uniref:Long-chain-alcohol oxidase FAO1-like n=1 Tax=Rhizophora mucronata TaxID=61149 RepID=A0A2P2KCW6_RHIMU
MRKGSHPLLRGRIRENKNIHGFSSGEMRTLASICEAIWPSLPSNSVEGKEDSPSMAVQTFYQVSGSQFPFPDEVAEIMVKRGLKESVILVRLVLWALSTRIGTLLICGWLCFDEKWPFIKNFSSMALDKREKALQNWFNHRFLILIEIVFLYVRIVCLHNFFSRVSASFNLLITMLRLYLILCWPPKIEKSMFTNA